MSEAEEYFAAMSMLRPSARSRLREDFNPDQPRDSDGKWGSGGGGASSADGQRQAFNDALKAFGATSSETKALQGTSLARGVDAVAAAHDGLASMRGVPYISI